MVPDVKINEFVEKIRTAAGPNLESVILYGSAASGDYHPAFSNVNLFCTAGQCVWEVAVPGAGGDGWTGRSNLLPRS